MTKKVLGLTCIAIAAGAIVWGQATSQISGTVTDATRAAVPDAIVKVTQTATGAVRTATTGADGSYVLANLPLGPYLYEVTKQGFTRYVQTGIVLQVDSYPTIDTTLNVGVVTE